MINLTEGKSESVKDKGMIFNIQHFSLDDGPGIRTVVFMKGCPLDCIWCHNPESKSNKIQLMFDREKCVLCKKCEDICNSRCHLFKENIHSIDRKKCIICGDCEKACEHNALTLCGKEYSSEQVMDEIEKDDLFFGDDGGVTFSGGEPFYQWEFLLDILKKCKQKGCHTCVETCGYTRSDVIIKCAPYIDLFLYDCKETDSIMHKKFTGFDNEIILSNLMILNSMNKNIVLRCPLIPGCNDNEKHLKALAYLAEELNCIRSIELMPYHPLGLAKSEKSGEEIKYSNSSFIDREVVKKCADIIKSITDKRVYFT